MPAGLFYSPLDFTKHLAAPMIEIRSCPDLLSGHIWQWEQHCGLKIEPGEVGSPSGGWAKEFKVLGVGG